jgi:hypothetical protein
MVGKAASSHGFGTRTRRLPGMEHRIFVSCPRSRPCPTHPTRTPRGPKGSLGPSKLDGKEGEISMLLGQRVSKASIAKILEVAPSTLHSFIRSRRLEPKKRRQA